MYVKKIWSFLPLCLALCFLLTGCGDQAREDQEAYKTIGIRAMEEGDPGAAVRAFDNALAMAYGEVGPEEVDICYYKVKALYADGKETEALDLLDALLDLDGGLSDARFLRGTIELDTGHTSEGLADYAAARRQGGKDLDLYIAEYDNLAAAGLTEEAEAVLNEAAELPGSRAADHSKRGRALTLLGRYDEAAEALTKAIGGGDVDALLYMGQLLSEQGQSAEAQEYYTQYLTEHGGDAEALNALGCMEMEKGEYEMALHWFEEALNYVEVSGVDPQEIMRNRILALEYTRDFAGAKEALAEYRLHYELDEVLAREAVFLETR